MKKCKDHLGNEYNSIASMCKHYGISRQIFIYRLNHGLSLEECLIPAVAITDNNGNTFKSIKTFCSCKHISEQTYYKLKEKGYSDSEICDFIEDRDSKKLKRSFVGNDVEFEGKIFHSVRDLCSYYGIRENTYYRRKERGFSKEECVHGKKKKIPNSRTRTRDTIQFNGMVFQDKTKLCKYYNVSYNTFRARQSKGLSIDESLFGEYKYNINGYKFRTYKEIANFYSISINTFRFYKSIRKMSLEEAVQEAIKRKRSIVMNREQTIRVLANVAERLAQEYGLNYITVKDKNCGVWDSKEFTKSSHTMSSILREKLAETGENFEEIHFTAVPYEDYNLRVDFKVTLGYYWTNPQLCVGTQWGDAYMNINYSDMNKDNENVGEAYNISSMQIFKEEGISLMNKVMYYIREEQNKI